MQVIRVALPPAPQPPPVQLLDAPGILTSGGRAAQQYQRAKRESAICQGALITDVWWRHDQVRFQLTNALSLHIYLRNPDIDWALLDHRLGSAPACTPKPPGPRFLLEWPRTGKTPWDPAKALRQRVGQRLRMLYAHGGPLLIYTQDGRILEFNRLLRLPCREPFLVWTEAA